MDKWRGLMIAALFIASLLMIILIVEVRWYRSDLLRLESHLMENERKIEMRLFNWSDFLEKRVNRVAQTQDEYQVSTSKKIEILEKRIERYNKNNE